MKFPNYLIFSLLVLASTTTSCLASTENEVNDEIDFTSEMKAFAGDEEGSWVPIPIPVANPTIGTGLQAALLYLHPKTSADSKEPNATSGILGMYTDSESWAAGAFHDGNLAEGVYRFRIFGATGEFNLDFFGLRNNSILKENPIPYTITGDIVFSQILRRIPATKDWYIGARYMYTKANVDFNLNASLPELPPVFNDMTTSSLGLIANYDSRDNNYFATKGSLFEMVWTRDSEDWGSDFDYDRFMSFYNYYYPLSDIDVIATRVDVDNVHGRVPFYMTPTLQMRGFPVGQYRGFASMSGHVEWRRKFLPRWGFNLFYSAGSVADSLDNIFQTETISSYGGGIRWQVTKEKPLNLGVDVGFSKDDYAVYVKVGEQF